MKGKTPSGDPWYGRQKEEIFENYIFSKNVQDVPKTCFIMFCDVSTRFEIPPRALRGGLGRAQPPGR